MPASSAAPFKTPVPLRVAFTDGPAVEQPAVQVEVPWLAGETTEEIFPAASAGKVRDGVGLFRAGGFLVGYAREPFVPAELAARSEALYRRILAAAQGRHLCRIWNYVPRINARTGGLEHYQAFCQGRSLAFEHALGGGFQPSLPAASAVGSAGDCLEAVFAASDAAPRHFENPEQVPAYLYPPEHGPRSPSFARATAVRSGRAAWVFLSGTAAIKGHRTVAPGQLGPQLDCTLDNLRLVGRVAGLGNTLGAGRVARRHFKVYLRDAADLGAVQARLRRELLAPNDRVTYLRADICRAALAVEIEATIVAE
jgi:chorismate lyase / 3-hydroxybenzoate synthase